MFGVDEIVDGMYDLGIMYLWDHSGVILCHFFKKNNIFFFTSGFETRGT